MKLITIKSEKDIKTLLLEEMQNAKNERALIILSKKRFNEFVTRIDVMRDSYDHGDWVIESDDIVYSIYENEKVLCCKCYGTITFSLRTGLYIVKEFSNFSHFKCAEETTKIRFIE